MWNDIKSNFKKIDNDANMEETRTTYPLLENVLQEFDG